MSMSMSMMKMVMLEEYSCSLDFETAVERVRQQALDAGWRIPVEFPLQEHYIEAGLKDMSKTHNLYLCNPEGGYTISRDDDFKPMFVLMPTPLSIYEDSKGRVKITRFRLGRMASMFGGEVKQTLLDGEARLQKALEGVIEEG